MTSRSSAEPYFAPAFFDFFRDLAAHNERSWFDANRDRYERDVREPMLAFVRALQEPLAEISPSILALAKKSGGSLFRIHRDVRFSPDKSPYKTWGALQFRHESGRDVHAPGFYLHLAPGDVFAGAGVWHPGGEALGAIRKRIDADPDGWERARDAVTSAGMELAGDRLKTAPRGVARDHPQIDDLRRKDFIAVRPFGEAAAVRPDFLNRYVQACRDAEPLMKWLAEAMGLPF